MDCDFLKNKKVAVLGYGMEGRAVTKYLLKHGVKPVLFDQMPESDWDKNILKDLNEQGIKTVFGPESFKKLKNFDVAFRSPGIPITKIPKLNSKLIITSQTKWFFEHCPAKIIGVTGTKGKGTTSTLIFNMLVQANHNKQNFKSYLTGNIGKVQPLEILDAIKTDDWVVYELSSFQLQDLTQSPHIAIVLMVTSEHLDYHKDLTEYLNAKSAISRYQSLTDYTIINTDFKNSKQIGQIGIAKKLYFSRKKTNLDCYVSEGKICLLDKITKKPSFTFPISTLQLKGEHNLENICASALAAHCAGVNKESIMFAAINFKGLEHRLEFVDEKNGIKFYNDSFSTTPETAMAAINAFKEPLILILGGSSKKSDFKELGNTICKTTNIKAIILIGDEAAIIKNTLTDFKGKIFENAESMKQIFSQIKSVAKKGDIVLLSPACASFGMFKNYIDRGRQFIKHVNKFQ